MTVRSMGIGSMGSGEAGMTEPRSGIDGLFAELELQRARLATRSPPYERALALLPQVLRGPPGRFLDAAWADRIFHASWDRPLLLLAALRHDAMREGEAHPLFQGFAAPAPRAEAVTADALRAALDGKRERIFDALAHRGLQTNDTSRAVAWLWPAALAGLSHGARPVALVDVGASAGLNLVADLLPAIWTDDRGAPLEVANGIGAVTRLGLDPAPLDATKQDDADWIRACVWPDDGERLERLELALAIFRQAQTRPDAPVLSPVAAAAVPARLDVLSAAERGAVVLVYQTVVRDYLPPAERAEYEAGMRNWLATQPPGQALWVELESIGEEARLEDGAAIVAHVRAPGGEVRDLELARCGFHPTRIVPRPEAVAALTSLMARERAAAHP
jgi:hypothetical protein